MMKQIVIAVLIVCVGAMWGAAQDTTVNVNSYTIPELPGAPVIDGDLSDAVWANVPAIPMDKDGDSPAAAPGTGDLDIVLKIAWDDETNALYFAIPRMNRLSRWARFLATDGHKASGWKSSSMEPTAETRTHHHLRYHQQYVSHTLYV